MFLALLFKKITILFTTLFQWPRSIQKSSSKFRIGFFKIVLDKGYILTSPD